MKITKSLFKTNPYRGIITELATEQGVTPQAIHQALFKNGNTRIQKLAINKMKSRNKIQKEFCSLA